MSGGTTPPPQQLPVWYSLHRAARTGAAIQSAQAAVGVLQPCGKDQQQGSALAKVKTGPNTVSLENKPTQRRRR